MRPKYVIQNTEDLLYLSKVGIERTVQYMEQKTQYVKKPENALQFETADEANSVITFIGDVIDWEQEQALEIRSIMA